MKRKYTMLPLLLLIVAACLSVSAVLAQDATATPAASPNLTYSVAAQGEITAQAFSQTWSLQTASADRISIRVERTDGNLIPDLQLLDSNGQQITASYDAGYTDAVATIQDFTLPAGGNYQVFVQRKDGTSGVTTGKYTVIVMPEATAVDNPNNTTVIGEVTADKPLSGEITPAHWYQRYTFNAAGADVIRVNAKRTGGTLFPQVEVLDANGTSLTGGYTDQTGTFAEIDRLELPGPGSYTVAVSRSSDFNGYTAGTYELNVGLLGAGEDNPLLKQAAGTVTYDTPLQGEINARWYQDYQLVTQAGDTLTLSVTRTDGSLQPEVILMGGSGQELNHGYLSRTGDSASIDRFQLQVAGTYTVRVSRNSGKSGLTSGKYTLNVNLIGSGVGSPNLTAVTGTVEKGTPAEGKVTNARWADTWTFHGEAKQVIDIVVQRTSGTLIPRVEIRDSNGQSLSTGYPSASADNASIMQYTLPGTADYQIVVVRDGDQNGYTSGGYVLTVKPTGT